jgi:hypothetical protein
MTAQELSTWHRVLGKMAIALNVPIATEQIRVLDEVLADVPLSLLEAAAVRLLNTARFWPRPAEWREAVSALQRERLLATDEAARRVLRPCGTDWIPPHCECCDDTGWRPIIDDAGVRRVRRCECVAANVVIRARRVLAAAAQLRHARRRDDDELHADARRRGASQPG